jgi:predicted CXXCH cytochrome family protein
MKSAGRLTCITCHNPHRTPAGVAAASQFRAACMGCHARVASPHPDLAVSDCAGCHMPKRRTEDAVHIVMTDHLIQRHKPNRNLVAPLQETTEDYHGGVAFYGSPQLSERERDLYMGIALAKDGADRRTGIALLEKGIAASGAKPMVEALIELANAYAAERNPRAAAENYRKALAIDPLLAMARYDLGRELAELGDLQGAREQYEQAIRDDPNLPEAHNNLGTLLARLGEHRKAAEHYQKAIQSRPVYAEAHNNLGRLYVDQGRIPEAQAEVEEALRCDPTFAPGFNTLGIIHSTQGRFDLAIADFEQAIKSAPEFAEAHYNLGRALHARKRPQLAMAEYRRAIQLDRNLAPAHLSLGVALGEIGRLDEARVEFQEALRLRPGDPDAQRNLQMLDEMRSGK